MVPATVVTEPPDDELSRFAAPPVANDVNPDVTGSAPVTKGNPNCALSPAPVLTVFTVACDPACPVICAVQFVAVPKSMYGWLGVVTVQFDSFVPWTISVVGPVPKNLATGF